MNCADVAQHQRPVFADPDGFLARVETLLAEKVDSLGELVKLANGKIYERDFVVVRNRSTLLGYLWKYREVTAWKSEHETLASILQASLDAVVVIGEAGLVEFWNSKAEATFGYLTAEAIGAHLAELIIPPSLRAAHRQGLERFAKTGVATVLNTLITVPAMHKNGREFPVELMITCIEREPQWRFSAFIRPLPEPAEEAPGNFTWSI
jgi:PAS domain S-box-containing protein